jgi:hypothetical protein
VRRSAERPVRQAARPATTTSPIGISSHAVDDVRALMVNEASDWRPPSQGGNHLNSEARMPVAVDMPTRS